MRGQRKSVNGFAAGSAENAFWQLPQLKAPVGASELSARLSGRLVDALAPKQCALSPLLA
jgi:hypothetical protein